MLRKSHCNNIDCIRLSARNWVIVCGKTGRQIFETDVIIVYNRLELTQALKGL